jgi:hypothetical protein
MKLSAAHDSRGSEHPDVRRQIDEEEVRMPSLMTPRAVQVTPLQLVFMNHEAPPSIATSNHGLDLEAANLRKRKVSEQRIRPNGRGSILDADPPVQGVKIARRITYETTSCAVSWRKASGV